MHPFISTAMNLTLVLFLIVFAAWVLQRFKTKSWRKNEWITILQATSLGAKEKLLLVEVNQAYLLLGVTPHQISTLHVFSEKPATPFATQLADVAAKTAGAA